MKPARTFPYPYRLVTIVTPFSRHLLERAVTNCIVTWNLLICLYFNKIADITACGLVLEINSFYGIVLASSSDVYILLGRTTIEIEINQLVLIAENFNDVFIKAMSVDELCVSLCEVCVRVCVNE